MEVRSCFLLLLAVSLVSCSPAKDEDSLRRITRQQPIFGITHLDIRDAILAMEKTVKDVSSKLYRHEAREAQHATATTKALNQLTEGVAEGGTGIQAIARQMAVMEERLLSLEALMQTTDERQRMMLGQLTQGLDRLLARDPNLGDLPPAPNSGTQEAQQQQQQQQDSAVLKVVKKLNRKLSGVEVLLKRDMRAVTSEVTSVGESLEQHMDQLNGRHDNLEQRIQETRNLTQTSLEHLTDSLTASTTDIKEVVRSQSNECSGDDAAAAAGVEMAACMEEFARHSQQQEETLTTFKKDTKRALEEHLATLQTVLLETYAGQTLLNTSISSLAQTLKQFNTSTQDRLGKMTLDVVEGVKADTEGVVSDLGEKLLEANTNIMDMLDDRASQTENLHNTVLDNHSQLSLELESLEKVEKVMIHTADSVLDTKRSIEFGIQQIILELGETVRSSGSDINKTLHDQVESFSAAILKNQTTALKNLTAKMEQEISQVWRQIGVMYQQMTQSVDLLDQLKDTTKEHMNASLSRVGNMDGTVGKINTKVADVESNLNYLLGRLSLVVSEFNLMKTGIGAELMRLRDNLSKEFEFAEGGDPSSNRYDVNRKRDILPNDTPAAGAF